MHILARIQAALGEHWFSGASGERIQTILALFPNTPARGYLLEQTLTAPSGNFDLNIFFDPPQRNNAISAGYGPNPFTTFLNDPLWQNLHTFWQLWATDPEFSPITNSWLEFDTSQPLPLIPIPGVFFRLDNAEFQPWYTDRAIAILLGHALFHPARQTIQACFAHLPQGARVAQLGIMFARPGVPLRVYVRDIPPREVSAYLHAVGFPGDLEEAQSLAFILAQKTSRLNLQLEILCTNGHGISPRLSLETKIDRKTGTWTPLLTHLVAEKLCSPENKPHVLNWPAKHTFQDPACTVKKYINHIKITLSPDTSPQAKAYLGIFISPTPPEMIPLDVHTHPHSIGSKAARLGELARAGFNVPIGFVIPTSSFQAFLKLNQLDQLLHTLLAQVPTDNLFQISKEIQQKIFSAPLPAVLKNAVARGLKTIPSPALAIRSSAQDEDLSGATFAGLHDTFLNIEKNNLSDILKKIKACYASLYTPRALAYRQKKGLPLESAMAVILQGMIPAELSGVAFTSYPTPSQITIETVQGSGEGLVSGRQEPEQVILPSLISSSEDFSRSAERATEVLTTNPNFALSSPQRSKLLETFTKIEDHFHHPQDIEWAFVGDTLYILQTRPQTPPQRITTAEKIYAASHTPLIEGPIAKAPLHTIPTKPYILLIDQPRPQYVPFLENALAVIAEQGGLLNHFAIVCRELDIPFVVIKNASQKFQDGEIVQLEINPTFSPTPKMPSDRGWVALTRFIPPLKNQAYKAKLERTLQKIPAILAQTYPLRGEVRPEGIFIHEDSIAQIISTSLNDLAQTLSTLKKRLNQKYDLSLGLFAAILVEPLFQQLIPLVGDSNTALALLRGVDPLYLSFGETYICQGDEPYLLRFGVKTGDEIHIPANLIDKARLNRKTPLTSLSESSLENKEQVEILSELLRLLMMAYEGKNKRAS